MLTRRRLGVIGDIARQPTTDHTEYGSLPSSPTCTPLASLVAPESHSEQTDKMTLTSERRWQLPSCSGWRQAISCTLFGSPPDFDIARSSGVRPPCAVCRAPWPRCAARGVHPHPDAHAHCRVPQTPCS